MGAKGEAGAKGGPGDKGATGVDGAAIQGNQDNNIMTSIGQTGIISGSAKFTYNSATNEIGLKGGNTTFKGASAEGRLGEINFTNDVADADDNGISIYGGSSVGIAAGAAAGSNNYDILVDSLGIRLNTHVTASQDFQMQKDLRLTAGKVTIDQQTLVDAATVIFDPMKGSNASITLGGNRTLAVSGWVTGDTGVLVVKQDSTGGRTFNIDLGGNTIYLGASGYIPSQAANAKDVLGFYYDGTNYYVSIGYGDATTTGTKGVKGAPGEKGTTGGTGAAFTATNLASDRLVTGNSTTSIIGESNATFDGDNMTLSTGGLVVGTPVTAGTVGIGLFTNDVISYYSSDKRLKENITPIPWALDKVMAINGVYFDWIELTDEQRKTIHPNKGRDIGIIAQEIEAVLPEVVTTRDTGYKAVKYEKIVALLIEAIKEQQSEIEAIKRKINE